MTSWMQQQVDAVEAGECRERFAPARAALLERAESYARDSRTFGDSIKLGRPLPDAGRWHLVYRIMADELRKVAASIGQDR